MAYPYERFLRFLVSRKIDPDQALDRYSLPSVGDLWFARAKTDLIKTAPYPISSYLESKELQFSLSAGVLEWAEKEGFRELWEMMPEFGELENDTLSAAFQLFINPSSRPVAGMLLLTNAPEEQLCETLSEYLETEVTPETVAMYRRIFWDTSTTKDFEWEELLEEFTDKDERHMIALALQGQTIHMARSALDLETDISPDVMLKKMLISNYMICEEARGIRDEERMKSWQDSTLRVIKEMRESSRFANPNEGIPTAGDFEGLFSVQVSRTAHPTLAELEGEIAPRTEAPPVEDEDA